MPLHHSKMCERENYADEVDRLPSKDRATYCDIFGFIISIISHIVDIGLDCNLAYTYYRSNQMPYFFATVGFIAVPALINTAFSVRMYVLDQSNSANNLTTKFTKRSICWLLVLVFQLAPVLRYFDALFYALKSKEAEKKNDTQNQRRYYELMVKEDSDVALLRVLECFLEAAPQQILQLTIIFYTHGQGINTLTFVHQVLSIGSSFGSMGWSMASYQRLLRVSLKDKGNISILGTIMQFVWHFLVTVSRILCISVIASILPEITILCLFLHWLIMTIWLHLLTTERNFCDSKLGESIFYAIFGFVYIFTHISLNQGRTLYRYVFFYTILFIENTIATFVWYTKADLEVQQSLYYKPIFYLTIFPFLLGLVFMVLYYKCFHPNIGYICTHKY
ncbi:XK-related protein 6 [Agrilus planipennis]|uniref:XK-related protein n=1 Tax=Agrilus planipennis TaxID=224129 RepID=A0A1W4WVF0_AGRPL|nr:XK-related protein 6 [Agrilus planipennis]